LDILPSFLLKKWLNQNLAMSNKRLFGLLGRNISHSFSPGYFNEKFRKEKIGAEYVLFDLPSVTEMKTVIEMHPDLEGFNVTIPYKKEVFALLDHVDKTAAAIGAVNAVKVERAGEKPVLTGYNTDTVGFKNSLLPLLSGKSVRKALVLGTGGASKAAEYVLKELGISYSLVSRRRSAGNLTYDDLTPELIEDTLLIVNTTPLGMLPNIDTFPQIPYEALTSEHVLYDLVYNPLETEFLKKGKQQGAVTKNGLEMLHLQAEAAWEIWNR
jgi:shikimate dehydrogenase